jgi:hypothetical protein
LSDDQLFSIEELIQNALADIYAGITPADGIDPSLWQITFSQLNDAVDQAFGLVDLGHVDYDFVQELKHNNAVFAAFKSHHQTRELVQELTDADGALKSFSKFRKDTEEIIGKYNRQWLNTEHTTAVRKARMAANLKKYQKDLDLYPNLRYVPSRAANPRDGHKPYYNTVLPFNHSWWFTHTPPLAWNCLCGIENTDEEVTEIPTGDIAVDPGLDNNPLKTGKLIGDNHPYVAKADRKTRRKVKNFVEQQTKQD